MEPRRWFSSTWFLYWWSSDARRDVEVGPEVLFFGDEIVLMGMSPLQGVAALLLIMLREVSRSDAGQIVQVRMKFRLLQQVNGQHTFQELSKGVHILHHGASMVCTGFPL